jgi:cytochrome b pre-mRNA-processing protein 3
MFSALRQLFTPPPSAEAHASYIALVARARNPFFYTTLGVPDSLDGRFELIVLHLFLLQHRLLHAGEAHARELSELFFADMDRSVRELGVADTGVRYRIKAMAKAYHGRLQVYAQSLKDDEALRSALVRNLYGTVAEGDMAQLNKMADYVLAARDDLANTDTNIILSGQYVWPEALTN